MTLYFDQYVLERDTPEMEYVATVAHADTIAEPAGARAFEQVKAKLPTHAIERVEFIYRPGDLNIGLLEYRGAVIYDSARNPVRPMPRVHVLNALLGYNGSGPYLSRDIMEHLGMSAATFDAMNNSVKRARNTNTPFGVLALNVGGEWLFDTMEPLRLE